MFGLKYADFCSVSTGMIIASTSFLMGVFFANQSYDYDVLFNPAATEEHYKKALLHYQNLFYTPKPPLYALGLVTAIGVIGSLIKVYKPNPDLQLFEYGSLALFVLGVCVFLTNIKTGVESAVHGNWGDVTEFQGIAVIGSSNIILLVVFCGVLVLQAGLWYTNWEYQQRLKAWHEKEARESAKDTVKETKKQK